MNTNSDYLEELVREVKSDFKSIKKDDYDSIIYEFLKVKSLEDFLIVLKKEVNIDDIFVLVLECQIIDDNYTIQNIIRALKEAWAFISYDKLEASDIIANIKKMEFKFISTSNSNVYFTGKIIISGELYEKSFIKYLDFIKKLKL